MDDKEKKSRIAVRIFLITIFLLPLVIKWCGNGSAKKGFLELSVLDVGQGDAILIKAPDGRKILIDGGPKSDIVGKVQDETLPFSCKIDVVLVTHSHADHINGINSILKRCVTPLLIINDLGSLDAAPNDTVRITSGFGGDKFSLDELNFYILWPPKDFYSSDLNNMSIVVLFEYKGFKALLTGDTEGNILSSLNLEDVDILKTPHHGSYDAFLEDLLKGSKPEIMVISVGKNSFGHPSSEVLGVADSAGIDVFRTDQSGDIVFKVDSSGKYSLEEN